MEKPPGWVLVKWLLSAFWGLLDDTVKCDAKSDKPFKGMGKIFGTNGFVRFWKGLGQSHLLAVV